MEMFDDNHNMSRSCSVKSQRSIEKHKSNDKTSYEICNICCCSYSSLKRKQIKCYHCNMAACMVCVKKYILSSFDDTHCLYCKYKWNREFIDKNLSQHFRTRDYKRHREDILCEREKARLPETQALLSAVNERLKVVNTQMQQLDESISNLEEFHNAMYREYSNKIHQYKMMRDQKVVSAQNLRRILQGYSDQIPGDDNLLVETLEKIKNIILPCPSPSCHAYLDNRLICDICHVKVCNSCHMIIGYANEENVHHTCKDEDVASVQQMKKDSKSCPGCGAFIYKIDGCDQMWCTMCHTAFSWKTGVKIQYRQIHNPHFYEWRRKHSQLAPGAVDADGCPIDLVNISTVASRIKSITEKDMCKVMEKVHREILDITYHFITVDDERQMTDPTRSLRIQFLKGLKTEEEWKQELQKHEKKQMKTFETNQVYHMYVTIMRDIFRAISTSNTTSELEELKIQMISLQHYAYENLLKINLRYGSNALPNHPSYMNELEKTDLFC